MSITYHSFKLNGVYMLLPLSSGSCAGIWAHVSLLQTPLWACLSLRTVAQVPGQPSCFQLFHIRSWSGRERSCCTRDCEARGKSFSVLHGCWEKLTSMEHLVFTWTIWWNIFFFFCGRVHGGLVWQSTLLRSPSLWEGLGNGSYSRKHFSECHFSTTQKCNYLTHHRDLPQEWSRDYYMFFPTYNSRDWGNLKRLNIWKYKWECEKKTSLYSLEVCKTPPFQRDLKCVEGILHGVKRQAEDSSFRCGSLYLVTWWPLLSLAALPWEILVSAGSGDFS